VYVYNIFHVLYVSVANKEKTVPLYNGIKRSRMMRSFSSKYADLKEIYF
jgi:hypothetical protein